MLTTFDVFEDSGVPWEKKIWGHVWHLYASDQTAVSFLAVEEGYRCSKHRHAHRANMFAVLTGKIMVQELVSNTHDKGLTWKETVLQPGQTRIVPSGVFHRFRVLETGTVVEVYWVDAKVNLNDIERLDEGGVDDG